MKSDCLEDSLVCEERKRVIYELSLVPIVVKREGSDSGVFVYPTSLDRSGRRLTSHERAMKVQQQFPDSGRVDRNDESGKYDLVTKVVYEPRDSEVPAKSKEFSWNWFVSNGRPAQIPVDVSYSDRVVIENIGK